MHHFQGILERAYTQTIEAVIVAYEKASFINVESMFGEKKKDSSNFWKFEMVQRLGRTVLKLIDQLKFMPPSVGADSISAFKTKLEEQPPSQEIIEKFAEKMEECINFICDFSISSHADASRTEL